MEKRNYKLYVHISPSNKRYYGITGREKVELRWQNGNGYKKNIYFYRAIKKYGWDNFKHIVLFSNLTKEEAGLLEQMYITLYDTQNPKYGYNICNGGEGVDSDTAHKIANRPGHKERASKIQSQLRADPTSIFHSTQYLENHKNAMKQVMSRPERRGSYIPFMLLINGYLTQVFHNKRDATLYLINNNICNEQYRHAINELIGAKIYRNDCKYNTPLFATRKTILKYLIKQDTIIYVIPLYNEQMQQHFMNDIELKQYKDYMKNAITGTIKRVNRSSKYKKVYCIELDMVFDNCVQASHFLGHTNGTNIRECINGKYNTAYGYHWEYYKEGKTYTIRENTSKKIICVETGQIFNNTNEIVELIGCKNASNIRQCLYGQSSTAYGLHFEYYKEGKIYNIPIEHPKNKRRIYCIELDMIFDSIRDALKFLNKNLNNTSINSCLGGKRETAYGYHWVYYKENQVYKNVQPVIYHNIPKKVKCIELNKVFDSISAAGRYFGKKDGANIAHCLKGKTKTAYGYHWEWYTEEQKNEAI